MIGLVVDSDLIDNLSTLLPRVIAPDLVVNADRRGDAYRRGALVPQRAQLGPPLTMPPAALPEFFLLNLLVAAKRNLSLGAPLTDDTPNGGLAHFQTFAESGSAVVNSAEMHQDATIYFAITYTGSPTWYDTDNANDGHSEEQIEAGAGETGTLSALKPVNVDIGKWQELGQALPSGRLPTPVWVEIVGVADVEADSQFQVGQWMELLTSGRQEFIDRLVAHATDPLPDAASYCFRDMWRPYNPGGPPEWQTLMPLNQGQANGERSADPDGLFALMQANPAQGHAVMRWSGHPNSDDYNDRRIPWMTSRVVGTVTLSFLSGEDYGHTHREPPPDYWLGDRTPRWSFHNKWFPDDADLITKDALANDWIVFIRPDPEYRFLLASDMGSGHAGNFDSEHQGNLESEIEQWLVPVGYRPDPGDRIDMRGRWIIDCGHDDFHAELHPYEAYATSHIENAYTDPESVTSIVVTGAWPGGELVFRVWPAARPTATARLTWTRVTGGVQSNLTVTEELVPADNPNCLVVRIAAPYGALLTKNSNDVYYDVSRRLATRYKLKWEATGLPWFASGAAGVAV